MKIASVQLTLSLMFSLDRNVKVEQKVSLEKKLLDIESMLFVVDFKVFSFSPLEKLETAKTGKNPQLSIPKRVTKRKIKEILAEMRSETLEIFFFENEIIVSLRLIRHIE